MSYFKGFWSVKIVTITHTYCEHDFETFPFFLETMYNYFD